MDSRPAGDMINSRIEGRAISSVLGGMADDKVIGMLKKNANIVRKWLLVKTVSKKGDSSLWGLFSYAPVTYLNTFFDFAESFKL